MSIKVYSNLGTDFCGVSPRAETTTSSERRKTATWRRCGATCAATGAASTNSSRSMGCSAPRCTGQQRRTASAETSRFSWRRARPWTSWTASARELGSRCRGAAAGWSSDCGGRGLTPLHFAAMNGLTENAQLLLAAKAAVDIKDEDGWGPQPMSQPCWDKDGLTRKRTQ